MLFASGRTNECCVIVARELDQEPEGVLLADSKGVAAFVTGFAVGGCVPVAHRSIIPSQRGARGAVVAAFSLGQRVLTSTGPVLALAGSEELS